MNWFGASPEDIGSCSRPCKVLNTLKFPLSPTCVCAGLPLRLRECDWDLLGPRVSMARGLSDGFPTAAPPSAEAPRGLQLPLVTAGGRLQVGLQSQGWMGACEDRTAAVSDPSRRCDSRQGSCWLGMWLQRAGGCERELCTPSGGVWCLWGPTHDVMLCGKGWLVVRSSRAELGAGSGRELRAGGLF